MHILEISNFYTIHALKHIYTEEYCFFLNFVTQLCNKLTSMAVSTFGRKRALAGGCCDGNLCNDHLKAVTTTTMTTTTTTTTTTKDPCK